MIDHCITHTHMHAHTHTQESHLIEMGIHVIGDRIVFLEYLKLLKKHKRDADRSQSLWSGSTPILNLAYHKSFKGFCFHVSKLNLNFLSNGNFMHCTCVHTHSSAAHVVSPPLSGVLLARAFAGVRIVLQLTAVEILRLNSLTTVSSRIWSSVRSPNVVVAVLDRSCLSMLTTRTASGTYGEHNFHFRNTILF